MNVLGIHYGHNATVAVIKGGELVFAMSEERFNRLKNSNGFPELILKYVYENIIRPDQIDLAVIYQKEVAAYSEMKARGFKSSRDFSEGNLSFNRSYSLKRHLLERTHAYHSLRKLAGRILHWIKEKKENSGHEFLGYLAGALSLPREKIIFCGHHDSHAYSCCLNLDPSHKTLTLTMDGEGDGLSSTVSVYEDFNLKRLSENSVYVSLGYFYWAITKILGMTPNEHEFKVMGLAPYAKQEKARELYEKLKNLITLDENLNFVSEWPANKLEFYLMEKLYGQRFDTISAFAQIFLEKKVLEWAKAWIAKTGIHELALSGGVFMNVKLNQNILELPEVEKLFVMPSGADESTPIGAAVFGYLQLIKNKNSVPVLKPISHLYLGKAYTSAEIKQFLSANGYFEKFHIEEYPSEFETGKRAAELLAQNQVVARFSGASEFGARALGNRSILAHPQSRETVKLINEMIKNRDFWMPFAASALWEDRDRYFINPKNMPAPFMGITFETTPLAKEQLSAAIHPYDETCRPQIVEQAVNPGYHSMINEFKKITGIGAVLNTSFNLHGEPNVESPTDALRTLENSGLKYLALGNFMVSKKI